MVVHDAGRPYADPDSQCELRGRHFERRQNARSSAIRVAGGTPVACEDRTTLASSSHARNWRFEIVAIEKAALFEERALHPSDEILDAAFCLAVDTASTLRRQDADR